MAGDALSQVNQRRTAQRTQARADQVQNSAGGYVFGVDDWTRALRFLVLGTEGGTYYVNERDLTKANADVIIRLAENEGERLVDLITKVSVDGRAPRQNPTLFALAACAASPDLATRRAAFAALPQICRIGTHMFIFARYVEQFRGWGPMLRRAVGDWYLRKPIDQVAYQAVKYRQREGWSHRDLLRLAHPDSDVIERKELFDWITKPKNEHTSLPSIVEAFEAAQVATQPATWAQLVTNANLPWEALPDAAMNSAEVWEALLPNTGITALIRQLGRLSNLGLIKPLGGKTNDIVATLTDPATIKAGRLHPLAVLTALATYQQGHGFRGVTTWTVVPKIVEALNETFHLSFGAIEPANKRTLLALDVSGSMYGGNVANSPLSPFQAEAALAMAVIRTEPEVFAMAFSGGFIPLNFTKQQRLDDVLRVMEGMPFDTTDCSVPMVWAAQAGIDVDTFQIYTDNETHSGRIHPYQALQQYRQTSGIAARCVVVGMTATEFTIADPNDAGMLDVVGLDTATPAVVTAFSRGDV